jgi:hypothetical protein
VALIGGGLTGLAISALNRCSSWRWLPDVTVRNLRVGQSRVSLRFRRDRSGGSRYEVLKKEGALRIVRQPPLDSLTVGLWERLGALISD